MATRALLQDTATGDIIYPFNIPDSALPADVTRQGNTFNGPTELVQTESDGGLPAIDGSRLTGVISDPTGPAGGDLQGNFPDPTIQSGVVTNVKLADMPDQTFKGNLSGGSAAPQDITLASISSAIATSLTLAGDVSGLAGSNVIGANKVTNAKAAQMAAGTVKANITGSTANPADVTLAAFAAALPISSATLTGNLVWVDAVNGNDGTGVAGNLSKPFLTCGAAQAAAASGQTVVVLPGTYTGSGNRSLGKTGVNWYLWAGVSFGTIATGTYVFGDGSVPGALFSITGQGQTYACSGSDVGFFLLLAGAVAPATVTVQNLNITQVNSNVSCYGSASPIPVTNSLIWNGNLDKFTSTGKVGTTLIVRGTIESLVCGAGTYTIYGDGNQISTDSGVAANVTVYGIIRGATAVFSNAGTGTFLAWQDVITQAGGGGFVVLASSGPVTVYGTVFGPSSGDQIQNTGSADINIFGGRAGGCTTSNSGTGNINITIPTV